MSTYTINFTDSSKTSFNIQPFTVDTTNTTLSLPGKGRVDYGEIITEQLVHIMENFSGPDEPANATSGQLWYSNDSSPSVAELKIFNSDGTWDAVLLTTGTSAMTGNLDLGTNKLINVGDATDPTDGLNIQTADGLYVNLVTDNNQTLTGLGTITIDRTASFGEFVTCTAGVPTDGQTTVLATVQYVINKVASGVGDIGIDGLTDVYVPSPTNGDLFVFDSSISPDSWTNKTTSELGIFTSSGTNVLETGATIDGTLGTITVSTPSDGDTNDVANVDYVLSKNTLAAQQDVLLTTPTTNDILIRSGSNWVNSSLANANIPTLTGNNVFSGTISVGDPSANTHVTTKQWVESQFASVLSGSIKRFVTVVGSPEINELNFLTGAFVITGTSASNEIEVYLDGIKQIACERARARIYSTASPTEVYSDQTDTGLQPGSPLTTLASYSNTNTNGNVDLNGTTTAVGQSFVGNDEQAIECTVDVSVVGSPIGTVQAHIYSHSGSFGTSSVPNTLLASSNAVDVTGLTGSPSYETVTFDFRDSNLVFVNGTNYVLVIEYASGTATDYISVATDSSAPTAPGNSSTYAGSWTAVGGTDVIFSVSTTPPLTDTITIDGTPYTVTTTYRSTTIWQDIVNDINDAITTNGTAFIVDGTLEIITTSQGNGSTIDVPYDTGGLFETIGNNTVDYLIPSVDYSFKEYTTTTSPDSEAAPFTDVDKIVFTDYVPTGTTIEVVIR
jgi:hypothetical protein